MAKLSVPKGSVDQSFIVFIADSTSLTGAGKTGLAYNTASLVCYVARPGVAADAQTLATQTVTGAHSDGGFVEIDATNMPGFYRLDLKDNVFATGVECAAVMLKGAAGMAPCPLEFDLTNISYARGIAVADFPFIMVDSAGAAVVGATVTCQRSLDAAAFADCTNATATGVGLGLYKVTLAAADMAAVNVMLKFTASGCITRFIHIKTEA
jgi:hypothetical protein